MRRIPGVGPDLPAPLRPRPKPIPPPGAVGDGVPLRPLSEWRCPKCGALLARVRLTSGTVIEVKCWRCKATVKEAA